MSGRPARTLLLGLALVAFVGLGLPHGVLGVAWPSMRASFDQPLSELGILLVTYTAGYLGASAASGPLTARVGTGRLLTAATALAAVSALGWAMAPWWGAVLVASVPLGMAGGLLDSGLNAHVALRHGARILNLLHGGYGIGATAGPVVVTSLLAAAASWRIAYLVLVALEAALALAFWRTRSSWSDDRDGGPAAGGDRTEEHCAAAGMLPLSVALFFVYTGLEVAVGQWSFSLLTEGRSLSATAGGLWVASYWAGLTAGRLGLGALGARVPRHLALDLSMAGAVVGTALLWLDPGGLGPAGLPVTGLSLATIFPTLVSLTPDRLGAGRTPVAVGFQLASAGLGAALVPGLAGGLIGRFGLDALGPLLVTSAGVMTVVHLATNRVATHPPSPSAEVP